MTNKDVAQKIVDRMTEVIDKEGFLPWVKPWKNDRPMIRVIDGTTTVTVPVKFWSRSGKPYTGVNPLVLALSGHTGEFITWNQAKAEGGQVKKGAKGWPVVYWNMIRKDTGKVDADGNPVFTTYPMLKYYTVFSVEDVDGIEPKHHPDPVTYTVENVHYEPENPGDGPAVDSAAESIVAGYLARSVTLSLSRDEQSSRAFYRPSTDEVVVPCLAQFRENGEFYSTLFHELGHSTGHSSRLNRFSGEAANAAFGSEEYSKEELVAEITAASILSILGLESGNTFRNSAAYVKSWAHHIKDDPLMFVSAAGKAEKAIDLILGTSGTAAPEPDPDTTPDPDGKPETEPENPAPAAPAFPKREDLKPLAFSYRIGSSYGQAKFSLDLLDNASAATLKVIYPMIDGIENAEERKNAWFTLTALAYYKAAENPEKRPAFRAAADLYREKTGEDFPTPETEESGKPSAPKTVTAAVKRVYSGLDKENPFHGIMTAGDFLVACDGNHAVFLRSCSPDLPFAKAGSADRLLTRLNDYENAPETVAVHLPTIRELKAWIKTRAAKDKKKLAYNLDGIMVNPAYLLNLLEALPGCYAFRTGNLTSGIVFTSGDDRGILMPLRPGTAESAA